MPCLAVLDLIYSKQLSQIVILNLSPGKRLYPGGSVVECSPQVWGVCGFEPLHCSPHSNC